MGSQLLKTFSRHKFIAIACLILIGYLLPYYILGEDMHIRVHDNLDSNIVWYQMLAESGQIFTLSDTTLPNVINGLPRSALPSSFDAVVWLYVLFEPMTAYAISQTIMRFGAFIGLYLLLTRHIFHGVEGRISPWITVGASLAFAMLPYWPSGALSLAGIPLALHLFLTIRKFGWKTPKYNWIILLLIPFFSNFILSFVFFLGLMGVFWLIDWVRLKHSNWPFFTAIASMTGIYLMKNYLVITTMFFDEGFISHREELNLGHNTFERSLELSLENFLTGHTHNEALQLYIIIPVILIALFVALYRKFLPKLLLGFLLFNVATSVWYAFWYWEGWRIVKDNFMLANTFNFARIHFLDPAIWYICFALALAIIWKYMRFGRKLVVIAIAIQCIILFSVNEEIKYSAVNTPTFAEFYSEDLFDDIEAYIGEDQSDYRVVSIGMHPTIAQYNGFYTLDTYNNSFPLEYKHDFREVIAPELEKNESLKNYFDTWGGRLYMYVAEHGEDYLFTKDRNDPIEQLDINTEALQDLGGDYILSAVPIENYQELGLGAENVFENNQSPWQIWLYAL
ncbi:hypothetical protein J2Z83_002826 [Virgibacillus natechei]|uniref:YkoS n=1 Tax=Virgibacillus natechei TaxID=1216297 RepID=A0ABS4IIA2_9BACI|nr:DUF6044 family protein [Virgibacillus natechei]MBP1970690.1 hypothetical protein [Virgibacillus natechei]UZD12065.1 DUF6044 family protein [Virgibacillus natechei]